MSVLKICKTFVFFLITLSEYSNKYRQGTVFTTDPWKRILKLDPCPYLVKYYVLKMKTKVLDNFKTDKKCFMKIDIESSLPEIWIRIRFHNGSRSPSLCCFYEQNLFLLYIYNITYIDLLALYDLLKLLMMKSNTVLCSNLEQGFWSGTSMIKRLYNLFIIKYKGKILLITL